MVFILIAFKTGPFQKKFYLLNSVLVNMFDIGNFCRKVPRLIF